ncbi:MAG: ArsA-related P-loop ATPase [Myxococcota bacterium]
MIPTLEDALLEARVLVCTGTGGVGKTTISAALALEAARRGRRTLVLTIDPARRLANAFGLDRLGSTPVRIPPEAFAASGPEAPASHEPFLEIMMLESRQAFDQLIHRLTPDEATRRRILDNRIYRHLSQALAGSSEYAAMAEVQALVESGRHDLIVVDTPPAEHALEFLRAPGRLQDFLDSRFFHALVRPAMSASRFSLRLFARPLHRALGLLERIAGLGFLEDLTELLQALDGLAAGLADRARRIESLLFGPQTRFVLVCRALAGSESTTREVLEDMADLGAPLAALVVNRVRPWPAAEPPEALLERCRGETLAGDLERLASALDPAQEPGREEASAADRASDVAAAVLDYAMVCRLERDRCDRLADSARALELGFARISELADPLDHLDGLAEIARQLTPAPRTTPSC